MRAFGATFIYSDAPVWSDASVLRRIVVHTKRKEKVTETNTELIR